MVVYEAARAMVHLKNVTARELQPAVSGKKNVQLAGVQCSSSTFFSLFSSADVLDICETDSSFCRCEDPQQGTVSHYTIPVLPFLFFLSHSQISMFHPEAVTSCNVDLENLISDSNRSIATLAITTLLKVNSACVYALTHICMCVCVGVGVPC